MKPGDRQIERGRDFKQNTGSSPNGVANKWLSSMRGRHITVYGPSGESLAAGALVGFDAYSIEMQFKEEADTVLVFKGPGMVLHVG